MPAEPFASHAQNGEDVVLWRALGHLDGGTYLDVGAYDPHEDSVSRSFYDRGWSGVTVEPVAHLAAAHRQQRPRDHLVEAVISAADAAHLTLHEVPGTGLSTLVREHAERHEAAGRTVRPRSVPTARLDDVLDGLGWQQRPLHFLSVDVEGAEADVLATLDLRRYRPWVIVVEATIPTTSIPSHQDWEKPVLDAGYAFGLFDGLSRYYVALERQEEFGRALTYPACALDTFTTLAQRQLIRAAADAGRRLQEVSARWDTAVQDVLRWREAALVQWSALLAQDVDTVAEERERLESSLRALTAERDDLAAQLAEAQRSCARADELTATARAAADGAAAHAAAVQRELDATRVTVSWRVTEPLRGVRRRFLPRTDGP